MSGHCVVIGAGQAAVVVAQGLRERGFGGAITLFGDEAQPPYQRPPLSKKFLSGELSQDRLFIKAEAFYPAHNITLALQTPVTGVDTTRRVVKHAGGETAYTHLVFATGTRARRLPLSGMDLPGVHTLRSIADVDRLRPHMQAGKRLVIIGAGYVGLEVAAVARGLGLHVSVVEAGARVLSRVVSPQVSAFFEGLHRGHGVELLTGEGLAEIAQGADGVLVRTSTGRELGADLVLVAIGALANTELADQAGIAVRDGILVDAGGRTDIDDVYAAGDCTRFHSKLYGTSIRLESVQNAIDQAKAVAASIMGEDVTYDPVPWFWSDQYEVKLQIAGLSTGYDASVLRGDPASGAFCVLYLAEDRLLAVDAVNRPRDHMMSRRLIGKALLGDGVALADPDADLATCFAG